ncbi:MAG: 50S ribosomal protein L19 [Candidatus Shapirobacteria bacterium]
MALKLTHGNADFSVGDTVRVNYKIKEKDKERLQAFDGMIIAIRGREENQTFVISKNATDGIRVERIIPTNSPWIESIQKVRSPKTKLRRSKLYYLRDRKSTSI